MKKLIIIAALIMAATISAKAQFFNGFEVGGSIQYANQDGKSNVGFDLRATKRVATWASLRAVGTVNGTIRNGFDRYGTAAVGVSIDALPFYVFADYGLLVNPSAARKVGMAFDAGVGLQVEVCNGWHVVTELAIDRVGSRNAWQSTPSVKAGVAYRFK